MSDPRRLKSHATSSSIVTTRALHFFFASSSRTLAILAEGDSPEGELIKVGKEAVANLNNVRRDGKWDCEAEMGDQSRQHQLDSSQEKRVWIDEDQERR
jgi:hypothetical protein